MAICLLSIVTASGVGDTLTQQQIDSIDFDSFDYRDSLYINYNAYKYPIIYMKYLTIDNDNVIQWGKKIIYIHRKSYVRECVVKYGRDDCILYLRNMITRSRNNTINNNILKLKEKQTDIRDFDINLLV